MEFLTYWQKLTTAERERLAAETKTKVVYLGHIAYGHRKPSSALAQRIAKAAQGAVTLSELRPDMYPAADSQEAAA